MKKTSFLLISIVLTILLTSTSVFATPVTWTLEGVTFDDGGTATGSFVYDADLAEYISFDIRTTAGTALDSTANYNDLRPDSFFNALFFQIVPDASASPLTGERLLWLDLYSALTNEGGTVDVLLSTDTPNPGFSVEGFCHQSIEECDGLDDRRYVTGGRVTTIAAPTPIPTLQPITLLMLILTLGLTGWLMGRKRFIR